MPEELEQALRHLLEAPPQDRARRLAELCDRYPEFQEQIREHFPGQGEAGERHGRSQVEIGDTIGAYRILERLGEGGMGTVYLAEQREPVVRRVALKVVKLGMDTDQVLRRFELERQALALMEHDNIAKVLDAGATDRGQSFFVMELVKGVSITEYCDNNRLTIEQRLDLFRQLCSGVEHAHQKGVIHRDLKPSNILVTVQGERTIPKIIDFGLARATDHRLSRETLFTEQGRILGTPIYMSPEQAGLGPLDIDTRTDVYSLGVILYELLAGTTPFTLAELWAAGIAGMQQKIREEDPPKPSTKVSTNRAITPEVARSRRVHPRALSRHLSGDLDWITMRAMEKDRTRRYQSVGDLARDVARHLNNQPVDAGPPSALYLLRKFVLRYRAPVTAAAVLLVSIFAGLFGTISYALESRRNANVAATHLKNLLDLSTIRIVHELREAADEKLWPLHPNTLGPIDEWLSRIPALRETRIGLRAQHDDLRTEALAWTAEEQEHDRRTHPQAAELDRLKREMADHTGRTRITADQRRRLAALEAAVGSRRSYRFADDELATGEQKRWRFQLLSQLVGELDSILVGPAETPGVLGIYGPSVPEVQRRRALIERVAGVMESTRAEWDRAMAAIGASPMYPGFEPIERPFGLVPIGESPDTRCWEFAHVLSGSAARHGADGRVSILPDTGVVLVLVPAATQILGAKHGNAVGPHVDPDAREDEHPKNGELPRVALDAFFLSKYELSQAQWKRITGSNPSDISFEARAHSGVITSKHPVENVTWLETRTAMRRVGFDLPTEAQWERAARAGSPLPTWGVERAELPKYINFSKSGADGKMGAEVFDDGYDYHAPVDSKLANALGFHHTLGNVAEWCEDWYDATMARQRLGGTGLTSRPVDPDDDYRSFRGASFSWPLKYMRCSFRQHYDRDKPFGGIGVRPAIWTNRITK